MKRMSRLAGTFLLLLAGATSAAPTDLDVRWGAGGMIFLPRGVITTLLQSDGALIAALVTDAENKGGQVVRFDSSGRLDATFGTNGHIAPPAYGGPPQVDPVVIYQPVSMALHLDGRFDVLWHWARQYSVNTIACSRVWARYLPSGQLDLSFGDAGLAGRGNSFNCCSGLELDSVGNSYHVENVWSTFWTDSSIAAFTPDGTELPRIRPFDPAIWSYGPLKIDPRDRLVIGLCRRGDPGCTFNVGRVGNGEFGTSGIASASLPGKAHLSGVLPLGDGSIVAYGTVEDRGRESVVVVRFTESGQRDEAFGSAGVVILSRPAAEPWWQRVQAAELPDGRLLVLADVSSKIGMARLLRDGSLDPTFTEGGLAIVSMAAPVGTSPGTLTVRPTGEFLVGADFSGDDALSGPAMLQFRGGDLPTVPQVRHVVEFFHAGYGHYFISADEAEIAALDSATILGWVRTGLDFDAYDEGAAPLRPVCRFWSDQSFAPKSSHFYTPYADECAAVKENPDWLFERNAFYARMPEGSAGARTCPSGTQALYRAYNNGMSGAPNHRYTTDPAVLDAMIAQGWTMEGEATTRVFACVPAQ